MTNMEALLRERFLHMCDSYIHRSGILHLLNWLETTDFFTAPASGRYHLSRPGGLCEHSLNVFKRLDELVVRERGSGIFRETGVSQESVAIVSLFHDVCKTNVYKRVQKSRKTDRTYPNGKPVYEAYMGYDYNDSLPIGHGSKSIFLIAQHMNLTDEETMAIRYHMGPWEDAERKATGNAFEKYPLAMLLHMADMQATYLDERNTCANCNEL